MKKHFTAHVIFAVTALAGQQAWALSFGRSATDAVLGQPLAFTVPVHVDAGERFDGTCLAAKVRYGDNLLPPNAVRTEVLPGSADDVLTLRVTTNVPVSEPIIEISLDIGCDHRFSRLFPVFADPPGLASGPAQVAPLPQAATGPGLAATSPGSLEASPGAARPAQRPTAAARPRAAHRASTAAVAGAGAAPSAGRPAVADNGGARKSGTHAAAASRPAGEAGMPRLKLEMEEPAVLPAAPAPGASTAPGAAGASASAPDQGDSLRQLQALQQGLEAARHDILVQREQTAALQAQLAHERAQAQSRGDWTPWLLAMLGIAAAAIAALVWKLRQQTRIAHSEWFNQSVLEPASVASRTSELPSEAAVVPVPARPVAAAPAIEPAAAAPVPAAVQAEPPVPAVDHAATRPFDRRPPAPAPLAGSPRELSVEELLDLEQQADFFIALGQEDAAVDLLMAHLRSAGGQSPLPYTKLLEIYRRQGDRAAYERTRARFNRRFNAYAPDWDKGPGAGRSLEDYPATIARLEGAWHSPIDAMAMLEALLFKRDDTSELFDLPAYRDVLVLYSLARDLWQHGGGGPPATPVDVLLPLDDGADGRQADPRAPSTHDEAADADTRGGVRTSFEMTGFGAPASGGSSGLSTPAGGSVHATLDELSLSPAAPTRAKPDPRDWRDDGADEPSRA